MLVIIGNILSVCGAIITVISLFLPWIEITNSNFIHRALDAIAVLTVVEAPYVAALVGGLNQLLKRPVAEMSVLIGNDIAFNLPFVDTITQAIVLLPVIAGGVAIIAAIVVLFNRGLSKIVGIVSVVVAGIALLGLFFGRGYIERLGISPDIPEQIVVLAGAEVRFGYWVAIAGLVLIIAGQVLSLLDRTQPADEFDYFYP